MPNLHLISRPLGNCLISMEKINTKIFSISSELFRNILYSEEAVRWKPIRAGIVIISLSLIVFFTFIFIKYDTETTVEIFKFWLPFIFLVFIWWFSPNYLVYSAIRKNPLPLLQKKSVVLKSNSESIVIANESGERVTVHFSKIRRIIVYEDTVVLETIPTGNTLKRILLMLDISRQIMIIPISAFISIEEKSLMLNNFNKFGLKIIHR